MSIQRDLARIEAALSAVDAQIEAIQTSEPVSDEGRDASLKALQAARTRVALLRAQAAANEIEPQALEAALGELERLEASVVDESELERRHEALCETHTMLEHERDSLIARQGRVCYAELRAELDTKVAERTRLEQTLKQAQEAEAEARRAMPTNLRTWPELAQHAQATYATEAPARPDAVAALFTAWLDFLDAVDEARGHVPMTIGGVNVASLFDLSPVALTGILFHGSGLLDERKRPQARAMLESRRAAR